MHMYCMSFSDKMRCEHALSRGQSFVPTTNKRLPRLEPAAVSLPYTSRHRHDDVDYYYRYSSMLNKLDARRYLTFARDW